LGIDSPAARGNRRLATAELVVVAKCLGHSIFGFGDGNRAAL
jgi:hypothetical protein